MSEKYNTLLFDCIVYICDFRLIVSTNSKNILYILYILVYTVYTKLAVNAESFWCMSQEFYNEMAVCSVNKP